VTTRDIRPSTAYTSCDVCGRTLLRGERAETYLNGDARRSVCDLCTTRALNEGWIREGTVPTYDEQATASDRRRSLFSRLRGRRERRAPAPSERAPTLDEELDRASWVDSARQAASRVREPRHVRAIPTSAEHKTAAAVDVFNGSEHRRTVAGVARSLGMPEVSVYPAQDQTSLVFVVVAWELCWYRYEIELSDDVPGVRIAAQGYELDELAPEERQANAVADEQGALSLVTS
jgi:hypothetical protein